MSITKPWRQFQAQNATDDRLSQVLGFNNPTVVVFYVYFRQTFQSISCIIPSVSTLLDGFYSVGYLDTNVDKDDPTGNVKLPIQSAKDSFSNIPSTKKKRQLSFKMTHILYLRETSYVSFTLGEGLGILVFKRQIDAQVLISGFLWLVQSLKNKSLI